MGDHYTEEWNECDAAGLFWGPAPFLFCCALLSYNERKREETSEKIGLVPTVLTT